MNGTVKKNCLARPSKENMPKMHDFGKLWCDLGCSWDVLERLYDADIAESQCVIKRFVKFVKV